MAQSSETAARLTGKQWHLLILLILSLYLNFLDRTNLSIAAPVISVDLFLSPYQMGLLLSAFFWTYAFFLVVAGWAVDRYDVKWIFGAGFFIWSVATLGSGLVATFSGLFMMRMLLGVGQATAFPSYCKYIAAVFPQERRGFVNALLDTGTKVGPALGNFAGGLVIAQFGWRALFLSLGILSLIWLIPWIKSAPHQRSQSSGGRYGPGMWQILSSREAWGTFLGHFCANYGFYFLMTWLPSYLVTARHYPLRVMAIWSSVPYLACTVTALSAGWLSDRWIARGVDCSRVRKGFAAAGLLLCGVPLAFAVVGNEFAAMALLMLSYVGFGLFASNIWAITQTLAGVQAVGSWTGLQNCFANFAGIIAPLVTGMIVSRTGSFFAAFLSASIILVCGAASYFYVVRTVEPVKFAARLDVLPEKQQPALQ